MSIAYDCTDPSSRTAGITAATSALKGGQLVVMPTDTLYGIGCDAFDNRAVADLLAAKRRGPDMPVGVLVGSWDTIDGLVSRVSPAARELTHAFWPGAVSLVVEQAPSLAWNLGDTRGTVMLRMPLHPVALELLRAVGPMAVSSANVSGKSPAATMSEARDQLGDAVQVYLDGGPAPHALASTIVDLSGPQPRVLREGAVGTDRIAEVLGVDSESLA